MAEETIYQRLRREGMSRRDFLKFVGCAGRDHGLALCAAGGGQWSARSPGCRSESGRELVARALASTPRVPVIWLEFQDCAGCSEALTRSQSPSLVNLVLNTLSIEYHETLSAAAGYQADEHKAAIMKQYAGKYLLVVEGSIPAGDDGMYCTIGGRTALDLLKEAAAGAAADHRHRQLRGLRRPAASAKPNPTGALKGCRI